jgi:hypothetical protein
MSAPRTFISYSWDDDEHKTWVRDLATNLRKDGVDVTLDQWHVQPGDQLPSFMERAIRESDFVLIVCTPKYKIKSDKRSEGGGGVAYEGDVIQGEVFARHNHRKFIPILRRGSWIESSPAQLLGKAYISLQQEETFQSNYRLLLRTLHGIAEPIPELGSRPELSFAPSPRTPVQDNDGTGLAGGGTVIRRSGNRPFVAKNFGFSFSRTFQGMLDIAETSDFQSMPRILANQIKRIDFKEYSAAEIALIVKSDPTNVINYSPSWCRFRKALVERLDKTIEEVFLMCTETLYGPEGESYTLAQTQNQGVFSGVMSSVSVPAQHHGRAAEVAYRDGSKEVHHKIFNAHAGDIAYDRAVENFRDACLDLPRLKIDTIEGIDFLDMTTADQAKYPKKMDPNFIRKGNVTFWSGKKLDGVFLGVGMIRFDDEEMHGDLITPNVTAVRFNREKL